MARFHFKRKHSLITMGLIGLLYLILWLMLPKPAFWGLDNAFKYQGVRAFAGTGSVLVDYPGAEIDAEGAFRPMIPPFSMMRGSKQAPVFSVLFMMLAGSLFKIFGSWGPFLLPLFGGWASMLAAVFLWRRVCPAKNPLLYILLLGVGTPLLFYSLTLWEHSLATAFVLISVALIVPAPRSHRKFGAWELFIAGAALATAVALRTEVILLVAHILLFWRKTNRSPGDRFLFLSGLTLFLLIFAGINYWQVGTMLPLHLISNLTLNSNLSYFETLLNRFANGYVLLLEGFKDSMVSVILLIPILFCILSKGWRKTGYMGYVLGAMVTAVWLLYIVNSMSAPDRVSHTFNSGGMLWVSPVLALSLLPLGFRIHGNLGMIWIVTVLSIALTSLVFPMVAGVHWGPRFILSFLPLLLVLASIRIQRWWNRYPGVRSFIIVIVGISIVNQIYSYSVLMEARHYNRRLTEWTAEAGSVPALTNSWWLAGDCTLESQGNLWFVTNTRGRVMQILSGLREREIRGFVMYEYPPYLSEQDWWYVGAEVIKADYFIGDRRRLRRTRLKVIL